MAVKAGFVVRFTAKKEGPEHLLSGPSSTQASKQYGY